jgi:hypothetical protein
MTHFLDFVDFPEFKIKSKRLYFGDRRGFCPQVKD